MASPLLPVCVACSRRSFLLQHPLASVLCCVQQTSRLSSLTSASATHLIIPVQHACVRQQSEPHVCSHIFYSTTLPNEKKPNTDRARSSRSASRRSLCIYAPRVRASSYIYLLINLSLDPRHLLHLGRLGKQVADHQIQRNEQPSRDNLQHGVLTTCGSLT